MELTDKEKVVLQAIKNYITNNHISPTVRELGNILNFKSTSTAHRYLKVLERKGYISKKNACPRSIVIINKKALV